MVRPVWPIVYGRPGGSGEATVTRCGFVSPRRRLLSGLRHTGNTLASTAGASTRELMTRMGHSSSRAALIYQHMTSDRAGPSLIGSEP